MKDLAERFAELRNAIMRLPNNPSRDDRAAIEKIGGTLPEDLPPTPHIKQIEKRVKVRELGKPPPK